MDDESPDENNDYYLAARNFLENDAEIEAAIELLVIDKGMTPNEIKAAALLIDMMQSCDLD